MLRATGRMMPPDRAVIDGIPAASVTSLRTSEYDTPSELLPNARTKKRAMRRDRPVSLNTRDISIAPSTSHTDGEEKPVSADAIGRPPTMTNSVRPMTTIAAPGSGCSMRPATVARKTPVIRQPGRRDPGGWRNQVCDDEIDRREGEQAEEAAGRGRPVIGGHRWSGLGFRDA